MGERTGLKPRDEEGGGKGSGKDPRQSLVSALIELPEHLLRSRTCHSLIVAAAKLRFPCHSQPIIVGKRNLELTKGM